MTRLPQYNPHQKPRFYGWQAKWQLALSLFWAIVTLVSVTDMLIAVPYFGDYAQGGFMLLMTFLSSQWSDEHLAKAKDASYWDNPNSPPPFGD